MGLTRGITIHPEPALPARLASEDVIISAPMSYVGSAQRIMRIGRRARGESELAALTTAAVVAVAVAWVFVTVWYLMWGLLLIPYRLHRRGARKRKAESLRHRELLAAIETSGTASAPPVPPPSPDERIGDVEREQAVDALRGHLLAGRLTADEFEHRLGAVAAARTWGQIAAVSADLPSQSG
ncbi:MAG TPA: DUF1707 domain-containing protein [Solirubrobacteraceae bacterium]|jgi:hypothetical protein